MEKRSVGQRIWRIATPLLIKTGIAIVVEMAAMMLFGTFSETDLLQHATEISAAAAIFTIPVLAWMFRKDRTERGEVQRPAKLSRGQYCLAAGIGIFSALGINNLLLLINISKYSAGYHQAAENLYAPSLPVQIVCVGIVIPIMEELMFRGLILKRLREDMAALPAVVFSAFFFGLYHGNLVQGVYGFVCGLLLAYMYERFGSIKIPILMHIVMNSLVCVLTEAGGFLWMFENPVRAGLITVVCVISGTCTLRKVHVPD